MPDFYGSYYSIDLGSAVRNGETLTITYTGISNTAPGLSNYYFTSTNIYTTGTWPSSWVYPQTIYDYQVQPVYEPLVLTPAQQRANEAEARRGIERRRRQRAAEARTEVSAQRKAERLLLQHLTSEQRDEYTRLKRFTVIGSDGRLYRVNRGRTGNVELIEATNEGVFALERFCIHPSERVPDEDTMLAQKLLIESDLAAFRRIANITPLGRRLLTA